MAEVSLTAEIIVPDAGWDADGNVFEERVRISRGTEIQGDCQVGRDTSLNGVVLYQGTQVGRYCSVARGAALGAPDHPTTALTTSLRFPAVCDLRAPHLNAGGGYRTIIGHDVWIGCNAVVLAGVSVGHGAVIGAGAVVTRDVRPYAVVTGAPAREVRRRFADELCDRLLQSRWWELSHEALSALPMDDPRRCLARLEAMRDGGNA